MRDLGAEARLINGLFLWSGIFMALGIIVAFGGALAWIIAGFWADWPLLAMLVGLWLIGLGMVVAVVTGLAHRGLH